MQSWPLGVIIFLLQGAVFDIFFVVSLWVRVLSWSLSLLVLKAEVLAQVRLVPSIRLWVASNAHVRQKDLGHLHTLFPTS